MEKSFKNSVDKNKAYAVLIFGEVLRNYGLSKFKTETL
jgi:hypothetical protein